MRPALELTALIGASLLLVVLAFWIALQVKLRSPERREQQRRHFVNQRGRLGDAMITEVSGSVIYYAYSIHGVFYTTSQDISALRDKMPPDPERLIGVASMKYAVRNPANSILLCEEWSGLRLPTAGTDARAAS